MPSTKFLSPKNTLHLELAFQAMATMPTLEAAAKYLKAENNITTTAAILRETKRQHADRFDRIYAQTAGKRETILSDGCLEAADLATENELEAMERTKALLKRGKVREPWRIARDMGDVKAKNVDKSRLLAEKPTVIVGKTDHNRTMAYIESRLAELDAQPMQQIEDVDVVDERESAKAIMVPAKPQTTGDVASE